MGFGLSPQTVAYGDHMKIHGSGTDVDVARGGWSERRGSAAHGGGSPGGARSSR